MEKYSFTLIEVELSKLSNSLKMIVAGIITAPFFSHGRECDHICCRQNIEVGLFNCYYPPQLTGILFASR